MMTDGSLVDKARLTATVGPGPVYRAFLLASFVSAFVLTGTYLLPFFNERERVRQINHEFSLKQFRAVVEPSTRRWAGGDWKRIDVPSAVADITLNPLVGVTSNFYRDDSEKYSDVIETSVYIRWPNVAIALLALTGFVIASQLISATAANLLRSVRFGPLEFEIPRTDVGEHGQVVEPSPSKNEVSQSAETILRLDVDGVRARTTELYTRSTVLLAGGVLMAFFGVWLFYLTLPEMTQVTDLRVLLMRSLRPTAMLLFVEGVSWFLLRQYRALIEDYKVFFKIYLRRTNYLIAFKLLTTEGLNADQKVLFTSLLAQEAIEGRLAHDETTEAIERAKVAEPSPIVELLREIKDIIPKLGK